MDKIKKPHPFILLVFILFLAPNAKAEWYLYIHNYCALCYGDSDTHYQYGPYATKQQCDQELANVHTDYSSCRGHQPCNYGECTGSDDPVSDTGGSSSTGESSSPGSLTSHFFPEPGLNDSVLGKPFFNVHYSSEFSDWIKESQLRWQVYLELSRKLKLARKAGKTSAEKINIPPPPALADSILDKSSRDFYVEYDVQASNFFYELQAGETGISKEEPRKAVKIPTEKESEKALAQKLAGLHSQLEATKAALSSLLKTNQQTSEQYDEWKSVTESAMDESWKRGKDMLINQSMDVMSVSMERQMRNVEEQIKTANSTLNGKELLEELKRLGDIKQRTNRAQEILRAGGAAADATKESLNTADAVIDPKEFKWNLEKAYDTMSSLVGNEMVQKALKIPGSNVGKYATYAKSIVDTSYNLGQEIVSWQRTKQLDRNSPQLFDAVNKMKERMENIVSQIKYTENKLTNYRQ